MQEVVRGQWDSVSDERKVRRQTLDGIAADLSVLC